VATSPDYSPVCSPDTSAPSGTSLDTLGPIPTHDHIRPFNSAGPNLARGALVGGPALRRLESERPGVVSRSSGSDQTAKLARKDHHRLR